MAELIIHLKDRELRRHPITTRHTRIGREAGNEVMIDNPGVSRHHATVVWEDVGFVLRDAGSANGVFVNGAAATHKPLRDGDEIQIGKFTLRFSSRGGSTPDELLDTVDASRRGIRNPLGTTALSADDIKKYLESRSADEPSAPVEPTPPAPAVPEGRETLFKTLAMIFGVLSLGLAGLVIYLLAT